MNINFLYYTLGLSDLEYHSTAYQDKSIILKVPPLLLVKILKDLYHKQIYPEIILY